MTFGLAQTYLKRTIWHDRPSLLDRRTRGAYHKASFHEVAIRLLPPRLISVCFYYRMFAMKGL